jgi:hypothetical protein
LPPAAAANVLVPAENQQRQQREQVLEQPLQQQVPHRQVPQQQQGPQDALAVPQQQQGNATPAPPPAHMLHDDNDSVDELCCAPTLRAHRDHLREFHRLDERKLVKAMVRTWFEWHWHLPGKAPANLQVVSIKRPVFLREHLNPMLVALGFDEWTQLSPLYRDWFFERVMCLSKTEARNGRALKLVRRVKGRSAANELDAMLGKLRAHLLAGQITPDSDDDGDGASE